MDSVTFILSFMPFLKEGSRTMVLKVTRNLPHSNETSFNYSNVLSIRVGTEWGNCARRRFNRLSAHFTCWRPHFKSGNFLLPAADLQKFCWKCRRGKILLSPRCCHQCFFPGFLGINWKKRGIEKISRLLLRNGRVIHYSGRSLFSVLPVGVAVVGRTSGGGKAIVLARQVMEGADSNPLLGFSDFYSH